MTDYAISCTFLATITCTVFIDIITQIFVFSAISADRCRCQLCLSDDFFIFVIITANRVNILEKNVFSIADTLKSSLANSSARKILFCCIET